MYDNLAADLLDYAEVAEEGNQIYCAQLMRMAARALMNKKSSPRSETPETAGQKY